MSIKQILAVLLLFPVLIISCLRIDEKIVESYEIISGEEKENSPMSFINAGPRGEVDDKSIPSPFDSDIVKGYRFPRNKQGIGDFVLCGGCEYMDARYQAISNKLQAGIKTYNLWWKTLEHEDRNMSSEDPIPCPDGYELIPKNSSEKEKYGFYKYRCISKAELTHWDRLLIKDAHYGFQSAVVLYSPPEKYIHPECKGMDFGHKNEDGTPRMFKSGCTPMPQFMGDYEDYVRVLATRYNGSQNKGKIYHYIVWNEVGYGGWFDNTPDIPNLHDTFLEDIHPEQIIERYVELLKRTHSALLGNTSGVMMYVASDSAWEPYSGHPMVHIGSKTILKGVWKALGTSIPWSVVVHPYGDPTTSPHEGHYNFQNLNIVTDFQVEHLKSHGVENFERYPQYYLLASEQGWERYVGIENQAKYICVSHELVMKTKSVIGATHSYFHSIDDEDDSGYFFGLLPKTTVKLDLSNMEDEVTGKAYVSTSLANWNQNNEHFCCAEHGLGCRDKVLVRKSQITSRPVTNTSKWKFNPHKLRIMPKALLQ